VILAADQGTTGTTCLILDEELRVRGRGYRSIPQHFPAPGWVEHDPEDLWTSFVAAAEAALHDADLPARSLRALGIANQRETTLLWDRRNGRPVHRAIVWQDRRTSERCRELPRELIRARTGLVPDPYFSATKLEWLLARHRGRRPERLAFGTVDAWLVWRLSEGRVHVTDVSNASRTMLLDLDALDWDDELLDLFGIDRQLLPRISRSSEIVAEVELLGATIPVAALAGDQQAALFGHLCTAPQQAKATYGTGSFVLVNIGGERKLVEGLLTTAAAIAPGAATQYAVEGAVFAAGAAVQWLRDGLGVIEEADETERLALEVDSTDDVYFVPALSGLGSPHWDPDARGLVTGITRGTTRAHVARATLEAIAFQVADILDTLPEPLDVLRADGGASSNGFLMQFQCDLVGCPVEVAAEAETTALGAGLLAGLAVGLWPGLESLRPRVRRGVRYEPAMSRDEAARRREGWRLAVRRATLR
jgi:glycerol kinase